MENLGRSAARIQSGAMRRIALINQKGGVGKTTTVLNLGAALAREGRSVVLVDLDPQANLTLSLGVELAAGAPSTYRVLTGEVSLASALLATRTDGLALLPTDIHLTAAELELASLESRESLLCAAVEAWRAQHRERTGVEPADYLLFDCPPSLGLLSLNALAAAGEVFLAVQTEFLALQGLSKLVDVLELVKRRLHPSLAITGIVACMYDARLRLAREVLAELRAHFPSQVFRQPIGTNVKLAESPSFGQTIFEYAAESSGARDYRALALEVIAQEARAAREETLVPAPRLERPPDEVEEAPAAAAPSDAHPPP